VLKCRQPSVGFMIVGSEVHQHADPPHPLRLLRPCRERPCRRAAKRDNELPPSNMDCHVTSRGGHAMEGTISHLDVLRCGTSNRPMTAPGQTRPSDDLSRTTALPLLSGHARINT